MAARATGVSVLEGRENLVENRTAFKSSAKVIK
jgi:hypothetical protein